jgi:hypothetical protein
MDSTTHDGGGQGDDDIVVRDYQTKMKNSAFEIMMKSAKIPGAFDADPGEPAIEGFSGARAGLKYIIGTHEGNGKLVRRHI